MSNPVLNRYEKQWTSELTPAGYPTMPGYEPGRGLGQADATESAGDGRPFEEVVSQWNEAPADAVDRGRMTYDDVLARTGILFGALLVAGATAWVALPLVSPGVMLSALCVAALVAFGLGIFNSFSRKVRPALIVAYALAEGAVLGALSRVMEIAYPGIVIQAVIATLSIFAVTLVLFTSGKVRNSPTLMRIVLVSMIGIVVYRIADLLLALTGLVPTGTSQVTVMGIPLDLIVGVIAVVVGAACLVMDFDQIRTGVEAGAPSRYAWACAFALMVTIVWMYLEILRIIARLRDN